MGYCINHIKTLFAAQRHLVFFEVKHYVTADKHGLKSFPHVLSEEPDHS